MVSCQTCLLGMLHSRANLLDTCMLHSRPHVLDIQTYSHDMLHSQTLFSFDMLYSDTSLLAFYVSNKFTLYVTLPTNLFSI